MEVIGAGLGRTGTRSLVVALERLGYTAYHGHRTLPHIPHWAAVELDDGKATNATALDAVLSRIVQEGYTAALDFPISVAYETLMHRYPDALVILTLRASAEQWAESFVETLGRLPWLALHPPASWLLPGSGRLHRWAFTQAGLYTQHQPKPTADHAVKAYHRWERQVRATVPTDRLLVHTPEDGWPPLCARLNVEEG